MVVYLAELPMNLTKKSPGKEIAEAKPSRIEVLY